MGGNSPLGPAIPLGLGSIGKLE
uniref:Uncharacterized protein n=1 Tax=Arundo donax TaxID=35708 RepID=A0A0A9F4W1_ARUDO